ncbi:MAG TPA: hypothetical protein VGK29_14165 [Paludibaculum sp.]|jgi:hypothetical protein
MERTWASLKNGISALGLVAGLIAVGYMVETSYHALLGIEVYEIDPKGYVLAAGRFLSDSIVLVLARGVPSLWSWAGVLVALTVCGAGLICQTASSAGRVLGEGLLLATAAGNVVLYGLPALNLEFRLTVKGQTPSSDVAMGYVKAGGFPEWRSGKLAKSLVCAHAPMEKDPWKQNCAGFPAQLNRGVEDWYVAGLAVTVALLVALWVSSGTEGAGGITIWLRNATWILVLLAGILAPISYGRLLRVDQTSSVIVFLKAGTVDCKDGSNADCAVNGILLAESSSTVVFYCTNDQLIWQVSKEQLATLKQLGPERVLDAVILAGQ